MQKKITVIIATRNRADQLRECLGSILKSSYQHFQILILDQSDDQKTYEVVQSFHSKKIKIVRTSQRGRSKGLNEAVKLAQTEILAFTDDDCLVSKNWLQYIHDTYQKHPKIIGVTGQTFPYLAIKHPNEICPATFRMKEFKIFSSQNLHHEFVGFGNNMSFKKSALVAVDFFHEWLGAGVHTKSSEEVEMIFRLLKKGYSIAANPEIVVFHNRWLNYRQHRVLEADYSRGFFSFLGYCFFTEDHAYAWKFVKIKIAERLTPSYQASVQMIKKIIKEVCFLLFEITQMMFGILTGVFFRMIHTLKKLVTHSEQRRK